MVWRSEHEWCAKCGLLDSWYLSCSFFRSRLLPFHFAFSPPPQLFAQWQLRGFAEVVTPSPQYEQRPCHARLHTSAEEIQPERRSLPDEFLKLVKSPLRAIGVRAKMVLKPGYTKIYLPNSAESVKSWRLHRNLSEVRRNSLLLAKISGQKKIYGVVPSKTILISKWGLFFCRAPMTVTVFETFFFF